LGGGPAGGVSPPTAASAPELETLVIQPEVA
jgi:hypothetical protein